MLMRPTALAFIAPLVAFTGACTPPAPPAPPPTPAPAEPGPLATVSLDALPMKLHGIVIDGRGPNLARMTLSTAKVSCDFGPRADDEERMTLTMVRALGQKDQWRVARLSADTPALQGETVFPLREAPLVRLPTSLKGQAIATANFNLPLSLDDHTVRFEVGGELPGLGCGSFEGSAPTDARKGLTMTVAGEAIPIVGAVYRRDPSTRKHRISLSTTAVDCDGAHAETELAIDVTLNGIGRSVENVGLGGIRIGEQLESPTSGQIRSTLHGLGKTVRVSLDGSADVHGYPVRFAGQTDATYCR